VEVLPCDNFTRTLEKHGQDLKRLFLEANFEPLAVQLPGAQVYLKDSKADNSVRGISWHLGHLGRVPQVITTLSKTKFPAAIQLSQNK
jgi:hypothetical protein